MDKKQGMWIAVGTALVLTIAIGLFLNYIPEINNFFQYNYAKFTNQFLTQDQVGFFTNVYYPLNSQQPLSNYYAMLNGTLAPQFVNMTRYIVGNQTNLLPLTSPYALTSLYPYVINPNALIYANNKANLPSTNSTFYYVYPLYEVQYTGNCSQLSQQDMQIQTQASNMISFSSVCNSTSNYMNFTAVVGVSNNTATSVDETFQQINPDYQFGVDYLYPLVPASNYNNNNATADNITISNSSLSTLNATLINPETAQQNNQTTFSINITDNVSLSNIVWYVNGTQESSNSFPTNTFNTTATFNYTYGYIGNIPILASITDNNNNTVNSTTNIYFTPNTPLTGTLQGYVASTSYGFQISNTSQDTQTIYPTRNIYSGNFTNGSAFIDNLYCWSNSQTQLTNQLQNLGYTQYPYLWQYQYNNTGYLCLDVNSTNALLNATANIDDSNATITPNYANLTELYPDYLIANATALQENFAYMINGSVTSESSQISSPYWFIPSTTQLFAVSTSPTYVYSEVLASQYYISTILPISGQEPQYVPINISTPNGVLNAVVTNATTYLYTPLLQNLTYQYQFNQPSTGNPVYCTNICQFNNTLVYQDYQYNYQYANPNFGYVVLPNMNQTLYYTPQFTLIANTPLINNTDQFSSNYGQLCLYTGSPYTCEYGLSPSQIFNQGTVNTFVMYQRINQNATYVVNGQQLQGWSNFEGYLNDQLNQSKIATIMRLNNQGGVEFSVTGVVNSVLPSFIIISPEQYNINPSAYPQAQSLSYSMIDIILFMLLIVIIPYVAYLMARVKLE